MCCAGVLGPACGYEDVRACRLRPLLQAGPLSSTMFGAPSCLGPARSPLRSGRSTSSTSSRGPLCMQARVRASRDDGRLVRHQMWQLCTRHSRVCCAHKSRTHALPEAPAGTDATFAPAHPPTILVPAGVDYEAILRQAEKEADVVIWDGAPGSQGWCAQLRQRRQLRQRPRRRQHAINQSMVHLLAPLRPCRRCAQLPCCLSPPLLTRPSAPASPSPLPPAPRRQQRHLFLHTGPADLRDRPAPRGPRAALLPRRRLLQVGAAVHPG